MALAGLAAFAATAVALDLRDHAAGEMSAAECAGLHAQLAANEASAPASVKFARDVFRLTGMCASRDIDGAIRDIEAALRADLDESAILLYADTLLNIGQSKRAAPWIRSAVAIALTSRGELAGPYGESDFHAPWLIRAVDRTSAALNSGNARRIADELEAIFARAPRAPRAERRLARIGLERLERADPRESLYWSGRLEEWSAELSSVALPSLPDYFRAISCGDRRAIRRQATLYVAGKAPDAWGRLVYGSLALIVDPNAEERALLAALELRFGATSIEISDPAIRESRATMDRFRCEDILRSIVDRHR